MQRSDMGRVKKTFQNLEPVTIYETFSDNDLFGGKRSKFKVGKRRRLLTSTEPDPDHATGFAHGIVVDFDLGGKVRTFRFGGRFKHFAIDINLPAVEEAAQSTILITGQSQRYSPVRTAFVQKAH